MGPRPWSSLPRCPGRDASFMQVLEHSRFNSSSFQARSSGVIFYKKTLAGCQVWWGHEISYNFVEVYN